MRSEVQGGDMLPDLPSSRGVFGERDLDRVDEDREHCVGCGV